MPLYIGCIHSGVYKLCGRLIFATSFRSFYQTAFSHEFILFPFCSHNLLFFASRFFWITIPRNWLHFSISKIVFRFLLFLIFGTVYSSATKIFFSPRQKIPKWATNSVWNFLSWRNLFFRRRDVNCPLNTHTRYKIFSWWANILSKKNVVFFLWSKVVSRSLIVHRKWPFESSQSQSKSQKWWIDMIKKCCQLTNCKLPANL